MVTPTLKFWARKSLYAFERVRFVAIWSPLRAGTRAEKLWCVIIVIFMAALSEKSRALVEAIRWD